MIGLIKTLILTSCTIAIAIAEGNVAERDKKVFSLFTVVTFPNDQCTTSSSATTGVTYGTCLSSTECTSKSGTTDGNCASGFGVCCYFKVTACSSTVTKNCTYIQNPGYSSAYTTTGACSYKVTPMSSAICQFRLDFDKFVTVNSGTACTDSFVVTGPTKSTVATPLNLCGILTGQHLYVENGRSTTTTTLAFTVGSSVTFNMKVSQIECSSLSKADTDCHQWLTGPSGLFRSYAHQSAYQVAGYAGSICIRREDGYCRIKYTTASTSTIDAFDTDDTATTKGHGTMSAICGVAVFHMTTGISDALAGTEMYNGHGFITSSVIDDATEVYADGPTFKVTHIVSSTAQAATCAGFYLQLPCGGGGHTANY